MSEPLVTLEHCRALHYCARGMREFCVRHNLDWQKFREEGMPADVVEATGDGMAQQAAQLARAEAARGAP